LVYEFQINRPIPKQNYIIEEEKQKAALLKLILPLICSIYQIIQGDSGKK